MYNQVLNKIIERATKVWDIEATELSADTEFVSFNPKSAHYAQMTTYLEDEFDIEVPFMKFKRCKTFDEATEFVVELIEE